MADQVGEHKKRKLEPAMQENVLDTYARKWFLSRFGAANGVTLFDVLVWMSDNLDGDKVRKYLPYAFGGITLIEEAEKEEDDTSSVASTQLADNSTPLETPPVDRHCLACDNGLGNQQAHYGGCLTDPADDE